MNTLLLQLCFLWMFSGHAQATKTDSLLTVLKLELTKERAYDLNKEKRINLLRYKLLHTDTANFEAQFSLYSKVFEEYQSFKFDSAFAYARKMVSISEKFHKKRNMLSSKILLVTTLQTSGFYKEGFDVIEKIDTNGISDALKSDYLVLRGRLNLGIGDYDNDAYFSKLYHRKADADFKNATKIAPSNDFERTIDMAFLPDSLKDKKLTPEFFYNFIIQKHLSEHKTAMVAARISYAYMGENRILFLAFAGINDIRSSTKETLAIFLLAQELFKLDRINDAYIFMREAARNAEFYGSRNRAVQIESILPLISSKLLDEKQHERDQLLIGVLIFAFVAILLFFLLVIYRQQMLRIKASEVIIKGKNSELVSVNEKLWESSRIKEEFIGLFFTTCSTYIEALDKTKQKTLHNIKLGRYDIANQILNSVEIKKEKKQLYDTLDDVFLTLFPNFITVFNSFLKEEDQIWPKEGESLNATLRIFALMRLGVSGSEAIAKILDYSAITVYTYRNRVKSKALIPPGDFEQRLMEVKFIDNKVESEGLDRPVVKSRLPNRAV